MKTIYVCEDSVTGIYSGIYDAWKSGKEEGECGIALKGLVEQELFCDYAEVEESWKKAAAVDRMIRKNLGERTHRDLYYALLSNDREKGNVVLGTMMAARRLPDSRRIMEHLSHPMVEKVFELSRSVGGEAHNLKGFLRFRELENGVLYAPITPKAQVLTCLAPHFADRLPLENWMIHDKNHQMFAVHEAGKQWVLAEETEEIRKKQKEKFDRVSVEEGQYVRLWKGFCRAISIEERKNPGGQLSHLPLRYRPNMTEFTEGNIR